MNDKLVKLMEEKKNNLYTDQEKEKYQIIEDFIKNDRCFLEAKPETVMGMLEFLGVKEEDALGLYFELVSPKNYKKSTEKERTLIERKSK